MGSYAFQGLVIALLILLSALISATETALLALGPAGIHQILDEEKRRSGMLERWRQEPNRVLAAILIANNGVNILASSMATALTGEVLARAGWDETAGWSVAIAVGVMTFLLVMFGEVVPKTWARHNARSVVPFFPLTLFLCRLVEPFSWALHRIGLRMISAAGGSTGEGVPEVTEAEIETMIRMGEAQGSLSVEKQELLSSVIDFSDTMTREILVPRTDVVALSVGASPQEVLRTVMDRKFTRYPVYDGSLDSIVGIVNVKDLLPILAGPGPVQFNLRQLAAQHKTIFAPETKKIGELLKEFQREHTQIAVVVDEFGGTAGIVTMEDVIEEIVGEIWDEHDKAEAPVRPDGEGFLVQARAPVEDVAEALSMDLPEQELYETAGGLVMTQAGRLPSVGEAVEYAGLRFEVRERTRTRLLTLHVTRLPEPPAGAEGDE